MNIATAYPSHPVLVTDDEEALVSGYRAALMRAGITHLLSHTDSREALQIIRETPLSLILLDLNMPFVSGEKLLEEAAAHQPGVPVIVVTGKDSIESVVQCMKLGVYDYLVKPVSAARIVTTVRNALQINELQREVRQLGEKLLDAELKNPDYFSEIITCDETLHSIFMYVETIAPTTNPVLLTGETGVGKELVAKAIHRASRRPGPFIAVNIAGLDDALFSDTLFGHTRGSFTGADASRAGLISQAANGTLFLDEIGDLPVISQVKLLRLLQEQEYTPLGQDRPVKTDARIIVATNADLAKLQEAGRFRPDLYYRLSTHRIHIPPLRKRPGDLPLLLEHFLTNAALRLHKKKPTAPGELVSLLSAYTFPGNVRELEAMVTDAVSRHTSRMLSLQSFKEYLNIHPTTQTTTPHPKHHPLETHPLFGHTLPAYAEIKRLLVEEALRRTRGNQTRAAELLQTSRQVISRYLPGQKNDHA